MSSESNSVSVLVMVCSSTLFATGGGSSSMSTFSNGEELGTETDFCHAGIPLVVGGLGNWLLCVNTRPGENNNDT